MNKKAIATATKAEDIKSEEPKKPANLRANATPADGFVLSVDGKLKQRYETSKAAMAAGEKLKEKYPVIQVAIYDAVEHTYTPVNVRDK